MSQDICALQQQVIIADPLGAYAVGAQELVTPGYLAVCGGGDVLENGSMT